MGQYSRAAPVDPRADDEPPHPIAGSCVGTSPMRLALVTTLACAATPGCRGHQGRPATTATDARAPTVDAAATPPGAVVTTPATPTTCRAPLVIATPFPDRFVDDAAAAPAVPMPAWSTRAMEGPFATRALAAPGCVDVTTVAAAAPFTAVAHCATGDRQRGVGPDNLALHRLVVQTAGGWWVATLARDHWPHGDVRDERPRVGAMRDLTVADRVGDGGAEVAVLAEEGPPGDAVSRRVVLCGVGAAGLPACADVLVARGGPFHDAGALLYRLTLGCDGTLDLAGWEGGARVRLVHGAGRLAFP